MEEGRKGDRRGRRKEGSQGEMEETGEEHNQDQDLLELVKYNTTVSCCNVLYIVM